MSRGRLRIYTKTETLKNVKLSTVLCSLWLFFVQRKTLLIIYTYIFNFPHHEFCKALKSRRKREI